MLGLSNYWTQRGAPRNPHLSFFWNWSRFTFCLVTGLGALCGYLIFNIECAHLSLSLSLSLSLCVGVCKSCKSFAFNGEVHLFRLVIAFKSALCPPLNDLKCDSCPTSVPAYSCLSSSFSLLLMPSLGWKLHVSFVDFILRFVTFCVCCFFFFFFYFFLIK